MLLLTVAYWSLYTQGRKNKVFNRVERLSSGNYHFTVTSTAQSCFRDRPVFGLQSGQHRVELTNN